MVKVHARKIVLSVDPDNLVFQYTTPLHIVKRGGDKLIVLYSRNAWDSEA